MDTAQTLSTPDTGPGMLRYRTHLTPAKSSVEWVGQVTTWGDKDCDRNKQEVGAGTCGGGERGFKGKEGGPQPIVGLKTLLILNFGGCIILPIILTDWGGSALGTEARH